MEKNNNHKTLKIGEFVTIYPRGKRGIYVADYWHDGKHCRVSLKTPNQKVAIPRARKLDSELAEGIVPERRRGKVRVGVEEAIEEYLKWLRVEGKRSKTLVKYEGILRRKFKPFLASQGIDSLGSIDLRCFDRYRATQVDKLSPKSRHNEAGIVKSWLAWCCARKLIHTNPLADQKFPKPKHKPYGGPTLAQINKILATVPTLRLAPLAILAFTGMRSGECRHLRPEDVDLDRNWIQIVSRPGAETKTGESRQVPIHPRLRKILEQVPGGKRKWFLTALPSPKYPEGGHFLNMKQVCEDFKRDLKKLDIPVGKRTGGFTLHSLRSSFKTICIHAGIPREVVDEWQGHAAHRPTASDDYYALDDEESQRFMLKAPFGAADPPGDGGKNGGAL